MATSMARDGRRRRVLNEEVLGGSAAFSAAAVDAADVPRYGEQANIEHHPQVSDFVPRKRRTVVVLLAAALVVVAASQAIAHFAPQFSAPSGPLPAGTIQQISEGTLKWLSAVSLLAAALGARLIHSLRRHRVGDVRGQYRVWKWVEMGCVALSADAVIGLHGLAAAAGATATGWSLTSTAVEWWLAPLALAVAWIGVRFVKELAECRGAMIAATPALLCYAVGIAGAAGWSAEPLGVWSNVLLSAAPAAGHCFALAALLTYARYVVLDVQGLIDHAPAAKAARRKASGSESRHDVETVRIADAQAAKSPSGESHDEDGEDSDEADQYLSKSERKRLRKVQQRRAA